MRIASAHCLKDNRKGVAYAETPAFSVTFSLFLIILFSKFLFLLKLPEGTLAESLASYN